MVWIDVPGTPESPLIPKDLEISHHSDAVYGKSQLSQASTTTITSENIENGNIENETSDVNILPPLEDRNHNRTSAETLKTSDLKTNTSTISRGKTVLPAVELCWDVRSYFKSSSRVSSRNFEVWNDERLEEEVEKQKSRKMNEVTGAEETRENIHLKTDIYENLLNEDNENFRTDSVNGNRDTSFDIYGECKEITDKKENISNSHAYSENTITINKNKLPRKFLGTSKLYGENVNKQSKDRYTYNEKDIRPSEKALLQMSGDSNPPAVESKSIPKHHHYPTYFTFALPNNLTRGGPTDNDNDDDDGFQEEQDQVDIDRRTNVLSISVHEDNDEGSKDTFIMQEDVRVIIPSFDNLALNDLSPLLRGRDLESTDTETTSPLQHSLLRRSSESLEDLKVQGGDIYCDSSLDRGGEIELLPLGSQERASRGSRGILASCQIPESVVQGSVSEVLRRLAEVSSQESSYSSSKDLKDTYFNNFPLRNITFLREPSLMTSVSHRLSQARAPTSRPVTYYTSLKDSFLRELSPSSSFTCRGSLELTCESSGKGLDSCRGSDGSSRRQEEALGPQFFADLCSLWPDLIVR